MKRKWVGSEPIDCELCKNKFDKFFIDGMTNNGNWALMCTKCHNKNGNLLGPGYGQKYDLNTKDDITPKTRYPKRECDSCEFYGPITWGPGYWQCPKCNVGNEE